MQVGFRFAQHIHVPFSVGPPFSFLFYLLHQTILYMWARVVFSPCPFNNFMGYVLK